MQSEKITLKTLFNPAWYLKQSKGWNMWSYVLLIIATVGNFYISFCMGNPVTSITYWTYIASILSMYCVCAITNAKPVNGVAGLLSALIYIVVALIAKNPADAMLQMIYIILLDIPVLVNPNWAVDVDKKIRFIHETEKRGEKHGKKFWYSLIVLVGVISFVAAYLIELYVLKTPRPVVDSLVLGSGFIGAILTTFRFGEAYAFWFIQGALQVILWGFTALNGDANYVLFFTYALFMFNDFIGVFASKWFHHSKETAEIMARINDK